MKRLTTILFAVLLSVAAVAGPFAISGGSGSSSSGTVTSAACNPTQGVTCTVSTATTTPTFAVGLGAITPTSVSTGSSTATSVVFSAADTVVGAYFGGTTSSFPALRRNGVKLEALLGDLSAYADINAGNFTASGGGRLYGGNADSSNFAQWIIAGGSGLTFAAGNGIAWTNVAAGTGSAAIGTKDAGVTRISAGLLGVGNGTAADFSASMKYTSGINAGVYATSAAAPTIASAGTIAPTKDITFISGTAAIATITAPAPIASGGGCIKLIPTGIFTTTTGGNIALASTAVVSRVMEMCFDVTTTKWYPSY